MYSEFGQSQTISKSRLGFFLNQGQNVQKEFSRNWSVDGQKYQTKISSYLSLPLFFYLLSKHYWF